MATEVSIDNLYSWLNSQPDNTVNTPYEIIITGLTIENCFNISSYIPSRKYVDLSNTELPVGLTTMFRMFMNCIELVKSPIIPNTVTSMTQAFENTQIAEMPIIPNSVTSMIETFKACSNLTDLSGSTIPSNVTNMNGCFKLCQELEYPPVLSFGLETMQSSFECCYKLKNMPAIPSSVTNMRETFLDCYKLEQTSTIPANVRNMIGTFENCRKIVTAPNLPYGITNIEATFEGCLELVNPPVIPDSVTWMYMTFYGCTSLVTPPIIPNSVVVFDECFCGCSSLSVCPVIPDSVRSMQSTFKNCTSLESATLENASLTDMRYMFEGCTSLEEINITLDVFNNFKTKVSETMIAANIFDGCTSLSAINIKETVSDDEWHAISMKITIQGASSGYLLAVGKSYDKNGDSVNFQENIDSSVSSLQLPILTDELMFTSNYTDQELEAIILKSIQYGYSYWNKTVLDVTKKNFVFWADDIDNFQTNLPIKPVDVVEDGNMSPVTSNAVFDTLANISGVTVKRIKDADCSTVGNTYSLDSGEKFSDWDFIIPIVSTYDSSDKVFEIIPKAEIEYAKTQSGNAEFTHIGTVSGTTRRMSWSPKSDTTFTIGHRDGTSSHLPHLWGFYGVKFG